MQGNVRRHWSERVILLGPDECQSGELLLDLGKEGIRTRKEGIRTQKYLGEKLPTTALNALQQFS